MKTIFALFFAAVISAAAQTNTVPVSTPDEQLKTQLAALVKTSHEGAVVAAQWLCDQAPQVANQYIQLCIFRAWMGIGLAAVLAVIGIALIFLASRCSKKGVDSDNVTGIIFAYIACLVAAVAVSAGNIYSLITAYVAPKVVIIEYVQTLVR
jgi:MFS family permease